MALDEAKPSMAELLKEAALAAQIEGAQLTAFSGTLLGCMMFAEQPAMREHLVGEIEKQLLHDDRYFKAMKAVTARIRDDGARSR